jgi:hypothetical protein
MQTKLLAVAVAAALGACTLDDERAHVDSVGFEVMGAASGEAAQDVAREAMRFHEELSARLNERGVTLEQMQAAVHTGDAERVRELFGFTPEELEAANERLQAIGAWADDALEDINAGFDDAGTEGLNCKGAFTCSLAAFAIAAQYFPNYVGLGFLVLASAGCAIENCEWDDGSGPRTKKP